MIPADIFRLAAGPGTPPPPTPLEDGERRATTPQGRVAIIEDELMVAWSLESMLDDLGYAVDETFSRGEAALKRLDGEGVDVVLLDINLGPDCLDGIETARRLRERIKARIIFISAYADPATAARVKAEVPGALLLRKPVSSALLAAALAQAN